MRVDWTKAQIIEYAKKHLPWIAQKTNMNWNGIVPDIKIMTNKELAKEAQGEGCFMAFCPQEQSLWMQLDEVNSLNWFKSAIIHELVHYLQYQNGKGAKPRDGLIALMQNEEEAYNTQACFLWEKMGIDPSEHNLSEKGIKIGILLSTMGATGMMKENA